jgi:arylsulfatase A-like enzyme
MVYVDFWIKKMFEKMKDTGMLDNTVVLITADHGSSYCYEPLRNERLVTNSHSANYHIPMFLYDSSYGKKVIKGYYNSKDVIPTLLEICGLKKPGGFTGVSMLDDKKNPMMCDSEYMGTGCPDIRLRPIQYVARNQKYVISYEVKASEEFENGILKEVYDISIDKDECNNLIKHIDSLEIQDLLQFLKKRHERIHDEYIARNS